jgi:hypothetical protein
VELRLDLLRVRTQPVLEVVVVVREADDEVQAAGAVLLVARREAVVRVRASAIVASEKECGMGRGVLLVPAGRVECCSDLTATPARSYGSR